MNKIKTVAIIGGGVSGLSAGGLLAKNGLRVVLFEANDKLGGCCANTNIGGYTFNDGALFFAVPGILDHVFAKLGLDRPSLLPLRKIVSNQTATLPDGSVVTFGEGLDVTVKGGKHNVDPKTLQKELRAMLEKWEPVLRFFVDEIIIHPFSLSRLIARGWRHLHKLRGTVASEIGKLFSDEAVRAAMSGALLYTGLPPQKTPVPAILGLVAMFSDGFYLPEGGMGKIPDALSRSVTNYGGEVFLNSKVLRIVLKNGRVYGLQVDGHDLIEVDAVISTISGMMTFEMLLDPKDVGSDMRRKVQRAPLSHRALVVQLGLSNHIDAPSYFNGIFPMMAEQYKVFSPDNGDGRWLVYSVPTFAMPELAPMGESIVEMFPPIHQDMPVDDWDEEKKNETAEAAIKALSRIHKIDIAVRRVLSPKDLQDRLHLYKGAIYGISPTVDPRLLFPHISPIPGLYQAGQTTYPGYGVGPAAISGVLAAEALMRREHL